jgi:hypothetical protein
MGAGIPQRSKEIKNRNGSPQMMTVYATRRCAVCHKTGTIMVDEQELLHYLRGNYVQDSFKTMSAPLREQVITGTHPECWQQMFGQELEETIND